MKRLLPGPYTFILEASKMVPKLLQSKRQTTGIRVPDSRICLALVAELGHPIISTSAAVADEEILSDPSEIEKKFGRAVDMVIDGGIFPPELSSVVSLVDDVPEVIRTGKGDVSEFQ
jgi:tRNA threonylcarbamoyl adenosine modification protein (Sua5/YciO/YrdC/YwlC family)